MPRKRKSLSTSPKRRVSVSGSSSIPSSSSSLPLPSAMSNNRKDVFSSMCEMFPNLDSSLVEMVLSEYKEVELVMDYLLELSTATKGNTEESTGFAKVASFLDDFQTESQGPENVEDVPNQIEEQQDTSYMDETVCNDLDTLLDEALDQYGLYNVESFCSTEHGEDASFLHNVSNPELDQAAPFDNTSFHTDHTNLMDQYNADLEREDYTRALDFDVTAVEREADTSSGVTEVENVQTDCKAAPDMMFSSLNSSEYGATCSQENVRSVEDPMAVHQQCAGPASTTSHVKLPSAPPKTQTKWNPMASSFYPMSSVNPSFIAPVAVNPSQWIGRRDPVSGVHYNPLPPPSFIWNNHHFPPTHWITENTKPINKAHSGPPTSKKVTQFVGKVLVLLRGAPGSGKSTLARLLLEHNPSGVILSTDDYFTQNGEYQHDISCLGEAHEWNHKRAKDAFEKNVSPIIIDNTNIQGWEMKPYVSMAMKHKYQVTFREPDTWWKYKPKELERRNHHGVKKERIIKMLENFERVTVNSILNLCSPKSTRNSQIKKDEKAGELKFLPRSLKEEETSLCKTPESGNTADMGNAAPAIQESFEVSTDGSELFPDVTKSEMENLKTTESENYVGLIQLEQDINSENEGQCKENGSSDEAAVEDEGPDIDSGSSLLNERPELLSFVGDWPVEQTMSQRAPRSRKARARHERHNPVQKNDEEDKTADPGTEQTDTAITHDPIDNQANGEDQMIEAASLEVGHCADISTVNDGNEERLQELENLLYTLLTKEDCAEEDGKSEDLLIDVQEQVSECTDGMAPQSSSSVNEEIKIKARTPRRNCRHCKLALNFTNNCATSSKPEDSECFQQPIVGPCKFSQTEPQDFALAWRVERNEDVLGSAKMILGSSSRFTSKSLDGSSDGQENIPYRVMHHKSTFVEEDDIVSLGDQDSLAILCKLFRSLSFDVLKDLFERCNKDLVWTTNLLLDSGEKMYKEEECDLENCKGLDSCSPTNKDHLQENASVILEEESVIVCEEHCENEDSDFTDLSLKASEYSSFVNALPLVVAEELKNGNVLSSNEMNLGHQCRVSSEIQELFPSHETITDTIASDLMWPPELEAEHPNVHDSSLSILQSSNRLKTIKKVDTEDIHLNHAKLDKELDYVSEILAAGNSEEREFTEVTAVVEEEKKTPSKSDCRSHSKESMQFDYLELTLPPEFAYQLTELFGPIGIDPGSLTFEDCVVPIDLKLAESIHQKWKESIMERQRQEALSYQLIFQDSLSDDPVDLLDNVSQKSESGVSERDTGVFPFMDQWNARIKKVSLRQIIAEEMALQAHEDSKKSSSSKNCAVKLKEKQLLELFPYVEQQLLLDIFKENNYSLEKTEQIMSSVLEADPVQNVIAQGFKQAVSTATEKNKEKKLKPDKEILNERYFQDLDYPNYDDFRAEAFLYHQKQQESYRKAAEAHNRGMKQVAAYYAQQGYLYGQKMKEEHRRAAVQIFERANEYLLPENILDLHGLHLDEAMKHFRKVLQEKTDEFKQNGGKPHLLVITGRGNHSQGGVPRIKPAVIDFLTNHDYRFQEKIPGVLRVTLK